MKLYDNLLVISAGLISINKELKLGDDVEMVVQGTVIERKENDNQDGTFNVTCRVKGTIAEVRSQEGKVISEEQI